MRNKTGRYAVTLAISVYLLVQHGITSLAEQEPFPREFDLRYIDYEELLNKSSVFGHPDIVGYVQLVVDSKNEQLLVGARDSLFRLSLDDLGLIESTYWGADDLTKKTCMQKGQTEYDCYNFIRVLLQHERMTNGEVQDAIFACGTNAYRPSCTWRLANNLSVILEELTGIGRTPYSPYYNSTAIITKDGDFYGATVIDITARDPAIYRSVGDRPHLRTVQYNSKWLNEPDFISAYEIGEFVFFFFREVAVEYINCGKKIYSRVARVCKTDRGGGLLLDENWTTYFKARLNCSIPGEYPFYFDEMQSTFYLEEEGQLYAVFTTPENSIAGSAVCVYSLEAFNKSFTGEFKYQDSPRSAWERHVNSNPLTQCPVEKDTSKRSFEDEGGGNKQSIMAQKYQMMDNSVQPMAITPLLVGLNERWTHVVVDNILGKNGVTYKVLFVATEDGKLKKMLKLPNFKDACLIEEIKIVPNGERRPVKAMKLYTQDGAIFISTFEHVLKFPVHRCDRFKDIDLCLNAKDPYCGWNTVEGMCGPPPSNQPSVHFWKQTIDGCPVVEHPVDGGWSNWTEWMKCTQAGGDPTAGDCLCRSRSCDKPRPVFGGKKCYGASIEVANCTTHGQWTAWSEWSQCSQSCGSTAVQWRQRYCSNPPPRYGGRECMGDNKEEEYCKGQKPCPTPPVQSNWTQWTEWGQCTSNCNGGIQNRRRSCVEPPPGQEQKPCLGNQQEWRMCNTFVCEDLDKMTPWTPWVVTNRTKGGYFQERFRFVCRANVPSQDMIKTQLMKSPTQFCLNNGGSCYDSAVPLVEDQDGGWSEWSTWSLCTAKCDGGLRWRSRNCDNPEPLGRGKNCEEHPLEGQECNSHPCEGIWGCWREWSPCSASCGGEGVTIRTRYCQSLPPGKPFTIPCNGNNSETLPCQQRHCSGTALTSTLHISNTGSYTLTHLFIAGLVCFLVGGSTSLILSSYITRFRTTMREVKTHQKHREQNEADGSEKCGTNSGKHSIASVHSVDIFRSKVYDIETAIEEHIDKKDVSMLDRSCMLKTFNMKDL